MMMGFLKKNAYFSMLLLLSISSNHAISASLAPCPPSQFKNTLNSLFDQKDHFKNQVDLKLLKKRMKQFDQNRYEKALQLYENSPALPKPNPKKFELHLAWVENQRQKIMQAAGSGGKGYRSITDLLKNGNSSEKRKLSTWYNHYHSRMQTEKEIERSLDDLSQILIGSDLTYSELSRVGIDAMTLNQLQVINQANLLKQGFKKVLGENELIRNEVLKDKIKNILDSKAGKWLRFTGKSTFQFMESKTIADAILFELPDQSYIHIKKDDLVKMMLDGVDSHAQELVPLYRGTVRTQIRINAIRNNVSSFSYLLLGKLALETIETSIHYQESLHTGNHQH